MRKYRYLKQAIQIILVVAIMEMIFSSIAVAEGFFSIDRNRDQFPTDPSYLITPAPYSIPGIGSGIVVTGLAGNIASSHFDIYALLLTGDVEGFVFAMEDFHLINEFLIFDLYGQSLNKAMVQIYEKRGMDTKADDFKFMEVNKVNAKFGQLTLTLFQRQFELFTGIQGQATALTRIRDSEGEILQELDPPIESEGEGTFSGFRIDYTDDRQDPKKGVRWEVINRSSPPSTNQEPDYHVIDSSLSLYIPMGQQSTWVFNYFTSDAVVSREGETDPNVVALQYYSCSYVDPVCKELTDDAIAQLKYGSASSMGGQNRLRSYPQGRYQGAHSLYYGTEFRWNLTKETTPFDYWIWKDVRTGMQLAFYYETATVADLPAEIGDIWRSSFGLGFRMVAGSGYVYRADYATGEEGGNFTIIFAYPW